MKCIKIFGFLFSFLGVYAQNDSTLIKLSKVVGDTISLEEKLKYKLFPYYKASDYRYSTVHFLKDSTYQLQSVIKDSVVVRKLSLKEVEWNRCLIEQQMNCTYSQKQTYSKNTEPLDNHEIKFKITYGGFFFSKSFQLEFQKKYKNFSFSWNSYDDYFMGSRSYVINEASLLYGLATNNRWIAASINAGFGVSSYNKYTNNGKTISDKYLLPGVALRGEALVTPLRFLGIGIYSCANLNLKKPILGIGLCLKLIFS